MNWITVVCRDLGHHAVTGWREPISISGQGKAAGAIYYAGGLVFLPPKARRGFDHLARSLARRSFASHARYLLNAAPTRRTKSNHLYGEADTGIPVAKVEALKAALAASKKTAEFKIYPGAPHGFHADCRASYRKEAADDAWSRMQTWLKKYKVLD